MVPNSPFLLLLLRFPSCSSCLLVCPTLQFFSILCSDHLGLVNFTAMVTLFLGFLLGSLTIIVVEALGVLFILKRLARKSEPTPAGSEVTANLDYEQSLSFAYNKQGVLWVLEPEKVPKIWPEDKGAKEQKSKKEILEVLPVKKHAKIKDHSLILSNSDGSCTEIPLVGCTVAAVSATNLSSRKWARRYPIKVEYKNSVAYNGSRVLYIYLETSWEKESWCKALRLASSIDKERLNWYTRLRKEFHNYVVSLNAGHPSFLKPSTGFRGEQIIKANRIDSSSSKVRHFWKKISKKASRGGSDSKASEASSGREEQKIIENSCPDQDTVSNNGLLKSVFPAKADNSSSEEDVVLPLLSANTHSGSQSKASVVSDADSDNKFFADEGTLCWNLLISRLFFDAKGNADIKSSIQARIQRMLSNMRTPSFIGDVTCTGIDLGNLPPYIHCMRVLPMDMNEAWAMEIDIEYSGGAMLDIETRLEVSEPEFQKGIVETSSESSYIGEATAELLEDFEYFGNHLKASEETDEACRKPGGDDKHDGIKNSKNTSWTSNSVPRWKSILNSIANQVSQVPLSLKIRVASLRGTLRLHIKPPPSDQLWFGFTSMPDVDFNLESSVGEHKVTNVHVALLLGNRFKVAIRETLVLPKCEYIFIPWMLAEKDDWVPRKVAPYMWINREAISEQTINEASSCQPEEVKFKLGGRGSKRGYSKNEEDKHGKLKKEFVQQEASELSDKLNASSEPTPAASESLNQPISTNSQQDLRVPLLRYGETQENYNHGRLESPDRQASLTSKLLIREQNPVPVGDDGKPKRTGRGRMMDLGKKMGEKLEEKRRHIEEKGRHIVEKMRGP